MQSMTPPDVQRRSRIIPYHYHNYTTTSLTTSKFCLVVSNKRTELKTKLILTSNIRCRVGYLPSDEFYLRIQNSIYKYTHTHSRMNEWTRARLAIAIHRMCIIIVNKCVSYSSVRCVDEMLKSPSNDDRNTLYLFTLHLRAVVYFLRFVVNWNSFQIGT